MFSSLDAGRELVEETVTVAGVWPSERIESEDTGVITPMSSHWRPQAVRQTRDQSSRGSGKRQDGRRAGPGRVAGVWESGPSRLWCGRL